VALIRSVYECANTMSDPRVTGTERATCPAVVFINLESESTYANTWYCSDVLTAGGGTWEGPIYGSEFTKDSHLYSSGSVRFEGRGAFAGLSYRKLYARERPSSDLVPYVISGWIEPAK
jgi:hypothetical protein